MHVQEVFIVNGLTTEEADDYGHSCKETQTHYDDRVICKQVQNASPSFRNFVDDLQSVKAIVLDFTSEGCPFRMIRHACTHMLYLVIGIEIDEYGLLAPIILLLDEHFLVRVVPLLQ
jgi:hypothetical protein